MSAGDWKPGCPNCPCPSCRPGTYQTSQAPTPFQLTEPECTFERIARDYQARGIPMPTSWLQLSTLQACHLLKRIVRFRSDSW